MAKNNFILRKMGYESCRKWAKKFYKKIGRIPCPALANEIVTFNNRGFNHLIRKIKIRSRKEQKRRFLLLINAENIIKNPKATIIYREEKSKSKVKRHGVKVLQTSLNKYWTFIYQKGAKRIKLVIRQINGGVKHFYSIM